MTRKKAEAILTFNDLFFLILLSVLYSLDVINDKAWLAITIVIAVTGVVINRLFIRKLPKGE